MNKIVMNKIKMNKIEMNKTKMNIIGMEKIKVTRSLNNRMETSTNNKNNRIKYLQNLKLGVWKIASIIVQKVFNKKMIGIVKIHLVIL